jgi:hypothetical protein
MQEASWAQEERQTMLTGEDADGYQVKTEERQKPAKRRRKKRLLKRTLLVLAAVLLLAAGAVLYLSQQKPQTTPTVADSIPFATPTPQPIKGYNAAPALTVSHRTNQAIEDISGPVEMATCAVTENNVLTRSMRADGLYDYYLFASDGRLLGYFDALTATGMHPVSGGGFYVDMEPWLVDEEGHAMLPLEGLEASMGSPLTLRPPMHGWAGIRTADGESNYYYVDFPKDNIRIVMLNCVDGNYVNQYDSTSMFSDRQVEWFKREALCTDAYVVVVNHVPLIKDFPGNDGSEVKNGDAVRQAIEDFIKNGGRFTLYLNGHTHNQAEMVDENGRLHVSFKNGGGFAEVVRLNTQKRTFETVGLGNLTNRRYEY